MKMVGQPIGTVPYNEELEPQPSLVECLGKLAESVESRANKLKSIYKEENGKLEQHFSSKALCTALADLSLFSKIE